MPAVATVFTSVVLVVTVNVTGSSISLNELDAMSSFLVGELVTYVTVSVTLVGVLVTESRNDYVLNVGVELKFSIGPAVSAIRTSPVLVVTILGTVLAMAIIMFIAILLSSLVVKMVMFLVTVVSEIGNRV